MDFRERILKKDRSRKPAPKVDHLRLKRIVTVTVMAITAAIVIMMRITFASFPPGRDFPGLQLTGRG